MRVQLSGRLGNQLFEVAHAIALSKDLDKELRIFWDRYSYPGGLKDDLSRLDLVYLRKRNSVGLLLKILDKIKKHSPKIEYKLCKVLGIHREQHNNRSGAVRVVSGFYQNYKWADNSWQEMKNLLTKALANEQHSIDALNLPESYQVLHYRCGDFLGHEANLGVLSLDYYKKNLDMDLPAIILTDSPERAAKVFKNLEGVRIILPHECNAWSALIVMSNAKLVIGSNSTLGWWGAFFSVQKGGRAVIPNPFYANGSNTNLYHPAFSTSESIFEKRTEE